MQILVIDGMGGGIGKAVIERIRADADEACAHTVLAIGTNAIATAAMHKAGADQAATGENAVVFNCDRAQCIIGTIGIVLANAMLGEVTPRMAAAVSSCAAMKILIPSQKYNARIIGVRDWPTAQYIDEIPAMLQKLAAERRHL